MKKFKNLALVLALVMVLNTILPQAAVFAQAANDNLAANGATVNVTLADFDPAFGTVTLSGSGLSGPGVYPQGSSLSVNVVANPGYEVSLVDASMGGLIYETPLANAYFTLTDDTLITVTFDPIDPPPVSTVNVQVEDINPTFGNVFFSGENGQTGNGAYPSGSTLNINVTPINGFMVTNIWATFADGTTQEVDNAATASFVLHDDVEIAFAFDGAYNIVVESSDPTRGTVFDETGSYSLLDSVYLYAAGNPGYECTGYYFIDSNNNTSYATYTVPINVPVTESGTYQMIFEPTICSVEVASDGNGTVTGGGNVANGTKVTLTATANAGYKFSQWTDQNNVVVGTDSTLSITVTDNAKYTASFVPDTVDIQVSATPIAGGTVSGDGTYASGAAVTLTATPANGYTFVNWIKTQSQTVVSQDAVYSFTASDAVAGAYTAVFEETQISVKISTIASPAALQTITVTPATGSYTSGTVLPLSATSTDSGVTFSGWYANGVLLSKANTFSYTVTEPVVINAVFGTNWGSVIVLGNPFSSRTVDIEVQPIGTNLSYNGQSDTYDFVNWTNSAGKVVSTNPNLNVQVQKGLQTFIANVTPKTFTISVGVTPTQGGTAQVTSATAITYGKNATVVATPADGYNFVGWTDGDTGQSVSTALSYSFKPAKNTKLIANFSQAGYTLTLAANPTNGGTVSGEGNSLTYGQIVKIQATPADGYVFNGWVDGAGNSVSNQSNYNLTITGNMSLTASFSAEQYPITVTANPVAGGTVSGAGSFEDGNSVTLTAIPNANYNFIRWTQGDSDLAVSTNPQYTFTASEASQGNYTAVFELETYLVNISLVAQQSIADQVSVSPAKDIYSYGTVLNMTADTTNAEVQFLGWYEDGKQISKTPDFDYTVTAATNLTAVFVQDYGIIITKGDPVAAQKTDILVDPQGTPKTISAATSGNYDFVNWTDAAGNSYPDATFAVLIGPDLVETYVAHYTPKTFTVAIAGQTPGGTVSQSQDSVLYGQSLTVTASPDPGYTFVNWTDALADPQPGAVLSTDANWILQPDANMSLQANFEHTAYTVAINVAASGGGTAAWANYPTVGPFNGDVITAVATPDPNFVFDGWVNAAGDTVSMDSSFDYTVTGDDTLTAQFHSSQNNIGVVANPTTMGTVTGGGSYDYKTQVTLTAIPNTGFEFVNWTNDLDDTVVTTPELLVDVANDITYTANFEVLQCPITLTTVDPTRATYGSVAMDVYENGVLAPEGTVPVYGDKVVLTATANSTITNTIFKDYLDGTGALISYDAVYTIDAITEPMDIQYDFVQEYTVTVPVSAEWTDNYQRNLLPGVVPQVTQFPDQQIIGNFKDVVTLDYGTIDVNLVFDGWYTDTDTPILVSSAPSFSYSLLDNTPLVAKLHLKDIGVLVENAYTSDQTIPGVDLNGGVVSGSGYRNVGESLNVSTTVDANYNFENWTQGDATLSNKTSFAVTVAGQPGVDVTPIQASYSPIACYLTLNANPTGSGQAAPSGYYPYGTLVTISQGNQAGYEFSHFEDANGKTLTSVTKTKAGTLSLYMTGNTTVVAVYKESAGKEAEKIVEIVAAAATAAAIAAGIAAAIYFGGDELLADAAVDTAEVALDDLEELAGGIVDHNPPDPDPDNPDNKTHVIITATASPAEGGTAIGGESYRVGEMAVLKATANPGWVFDKWSSAGAVVIDDPETKSISFLVDEADEGAVLTAHFNQEFTITTSANPEIGGTVSPTQKVVSGETATVTATPGDGYLFDGWYENGVQVAAEESYTLAAVEADHNLTAQFEAGFNVSLTTDPATMDTLVTFTGDGLSKTGEHTITATLDETETDNYIFKGWFSALTDDVPASTSETYTFDLTADTSYIASYQKNAFTVTAKSEDVTQGTVTQTGTSPYKLSDSVTVSAVALDGYDFTNWTDENNAVVSQDAVYTFDVTTDTTLTANFKETAAVTILVQCDYVEGGTVTSDDVDIPETGLAVKNGESVTLKAEEKKGYEFEGWYENGKEVEKKDSYTFTAEKNRTIIAAFSHKGIMALAFPDPLEGGRVYKVYQTSETKDEFYLNAVPFDGYDFVGWYDIAGIKVCDTPEYDFVAYYSRILFAKFKLQQVDVNVSITPNGGGTVAGSGSYDYATAVTLTATPEEGYIFNGYIDVTGNLVSSASVYTFTLRTEADLTASFSAQTYTVTTTVNDPTLGNISNGSNSDGVYPAGAVVSLQALPTTGSQFMGWFENGQCVSQTADYTFTATADRNLEADFSNEEYVLTLMADPVSGGTLSGEGGYNPSSDAEQASISAVASPGYAFTAWTDADSGEQVSTLSSDAITLTKNTNLTAVFTPNVYQVSVTVGDGGTATGDGYYNFGDTVNLAASANFGYTFAGWMMTDAEGNQNCISADADYTFTLNEDWINETPINISATFKNTQGALIIPLAEEYLRGNIARGYHLDAAIGEATTVEAIPGYGYEFTNWTDVKGNVLSQDAVYTFTVSGDTVLVAHFKSNATVKFAVTEQSILQGKAFLVGDVISGEKTVESGQYVMAYAVAYPGHKFLHWVNQNGLKVSNARSYLARIYEDTTLTAVFEKTTHDIRANVDPEGTGYVFGQKTYAYGDTATLTAIPLKSGYILGYWSDENGRIKGAVSPVFKTTVNGSKTYTAHFVKLSSQYQITTKAVPEAGGTTTGDGAFGKNDVVTLTATPNTGYQFDGWFVDGTSVGTDASRSFEATESVDAEAHFSTIPPATIEVPDYHLPGIGPGRGPK